MKVIKTLIRGIYLMLNPFMWMGIIYSEIISQFRFGCHIHDAYELWLISDSKDEGKNAGT